MEAAAIAGRRRAASLIQVILLAAGLLALRIDPAVAQPVDIRVTIDEVKATDTLDVGGRADFFPRVNIDGHRRAGNTREDDNHPTQDWEFSRSGIDPAAGPVSIEIELYDEDGGFRGRNDHVDITEGPGRNLDLRLDAVNCEISGDVTGICGQVLGSRGRSSDRARIGFKIDVTEPASAAGLNVRCWHSPIWPQINDPVTITVEALNGALAPQTVDAIEVWVDTTPDSAGNPSAPTTSTPAASSATTTVGPFPPGSQFAYGCRVLNDGLVAWTGWRRTAAGPFTAARAVPVIHTGPRDSRLDFVLIADQDDFPGATSPAFLGAVEAVIRDAFYQRATTFSTNQDLFLRHQDQFNFWIAQDRGDANAYVDDCEHDLPAGWDEDYAFADAGPILHLDSFRDCAPFDDRVYSTEPTFGGVPGAATDWMTILHETGHTPFGMADEYGRDGGYWEADAHPNLFEGGTDCRRNAERFGGDLPNCRRFGVVETVFFTYRDFWHTSDRKNDDLMQDTGNHTPRPLDLRRIEYVLDLCRGASC